ARPADTLPPPGSGKQLVDHLIGKTTATPVRDLERRTAGTALRSPSGLAPHPAGATAQLVGLSLGLRRHDAPFRSCLHSGSDTPRLAGGREPHPPLLGRGGLPVRLAAGAAA